MPAVSLSRVGARVVESGPDGQVLAAEPGRGWAALPDPRSRQGRVYPLACLITVALCAFTAAGNYRLTAVGQWIRRARQADLARLHARVQAVQHDPDRLLIRVVLDRLDPRALARALLGGRPGRRQGGGAPAASVRGYRARQGAGQAKALARGRLRAVAVDGKTSRGARRADGTRVHLLGAAEHGGRLLDHLEVDVKHNETSHFTELLGPLDLAGAVVTFDAPPYGAGEPGLAGQPKERAVHRRGQAEPAAAARSGQRPAVAACADRQRHPRQGARPRRDPHSQGRPRQRTRSSRRLPGHQDHPLAERHRRQPGLPADRLRRHQPGQRPGRRRRPGPPGPRAVVHRGAPPTDATSPSAKTTRPAGPAAGPSTWPPSAPPSPRPSKTPATCTSPKAGATTPPPPKRSAATASIKTDADIHGTRRSPAPPAREVLENRGTGFVVEVGTLGSDIPQIGVGYHGVGVRNGDRQRLDVAQVISPPMVEACFT